MSLFESYEHDFQSIATSIGKKTTTQLPQLQNEAYKTLQRAIERELDEADEILQSMEMELNSLPSAQKAPMQGRMKQCKQDFDRLQADYKKTLSKQSERNELLGEEYPNTEGVSMDQRAHLLQNTSRLDAASRRLEESHRVALETEQIGASTLEQLRAQRQQLERATDTLDEANGFIDRNVRILKSMGRRVATNRVLSIGIIAALCFIIILILVVKFS